jgi:hypothetical protein
MNMLANEGKERLTADKTIGHVTRVRFLGFIEFFVKLEQSWRAFSWIHIFFG